MKWTEAKRFLKFSPPSFHRGQVGSVVLRHGFKFNPFRASVLAGVPVVPRRFTLLAVTLQTCEVSKTSQVSGRCPTAAF